MNTEEKLANLAKEIGVEYTSLDQLIESFLRIREWNKEYKEESHKQWNGTIERAKKSFEELYIPREYLSRKQLSEMTVTQLAEWIEN